MSTVSKRPLRGIRLPNPVLLLTVSIACLSAILFPAKARAAQPELTSWDDLADKRVGMITGAPFEEVVRGKNPDVGEISYFSSTPDLLVALRSSKVDAALNNLAVGTLAVNRNPDLALFPESLLHSEQGVVFAKGSELHDEWARVIERMRDDGTADELWEKWCSSDEGTKTLPEQDWPGTNGTLRVAACASLEPSSYFAEGKLLGYDIETLLVAAKELDVHLEFKPVEFSEIMAMVEAGKVDMGCGSILVTDERREVVDFAVEHANDLVLIVRADASAGDLEYESIADLAGKRVGMAAGGVFDQLIGQHAPDITDYSYYSTYADMVAALKSGKIDALIADEPACRLLVNRNTGIALMPEALVDDDYGFVLPKGDALTERMNAIISRLSDDGTLDALAQKWCGLDEDAKTVPEQDWDTSNGTLRVAAYAQNEPLAYLRDGQVVGYDIEVMMLIAKELGMGVEFTDMSFEALLSSVQVGKVDVAIGGISITDERKQGVDMTEPVYYGAATFVVRSTDEGEAASFLDGLSASFERTFITENRWKLILSGLGVTLLVAICSGVLGTVLGFATVLLRRRASRKFDLLVSAFEGLMGRLPIVVVLMVFFYVIFGSMNIPGTAVAIVVFTLAFGASAGAIMWNAVRAVDVGQSEASLALGFSDRQTFFGVVLPQAARNFMPLLQGQFVSLVKDTSVVGYIAVTDLTRAGDLIRSRTMEAFFPLFATAAIYFALCCVLAWIIGLVIRRLDPERRPRTIKGVEL